MESPLPPERPRTRAPSHIPPGPPLSAQRQTQRQHRLSPKSKSSNDSESSNDKSSQEDKSGEEDEEKNVEDSNKDKDEEHIIQGMLLVW